MSASELIALKRCEGCGDAIQTAADGRDEADDHISIEARADALDAPGRTEVHYHIDCAPLGNTSVPSILGVDDL